MAGFNNHNAYTSAVAIVVAALESKSISLRGPTHDVSESPGQAKVDAEYLNTLINSLAANLSKE